MKVPKREHYSSSWEQSSGNVVQVFRPGDQVEKIESGVIQREVIIEVMKVSEGIRLIE